LGGRRHVFGADFSYTIQIREKPLCSPECVEKANAAKFR
jgi:hypothetical protein